MNAGALPQLLLCAALALALVAAPWRLAATVTFFVASIAVASTPIPSQWRDAIFLGCWLSVVASIASAHVAHGPLAVAVALFAGTCAGAMTAVAGSWPDLLYGFFLLTALIPLGLVMRRRAPIALHVFASWLLAAVLITAALQIVSETPIYLPDHLE